MFKIQLIKMHRIPWVGFVAGTVHEFQFYGILIFEGDKFAFFSYDGPRRSVFLQLIDADFRQFMAVYLIYKYNIVLKTFYKNPWFKICGRGLHAYILYYLSGSEMCFRQDPVVQYY